MVLEIACDQIQHTARHASGYALRFPRIKRIRWDKRPEDADRLGGWPRSTRALRISQRPRQWKRFRKQASSTDVAEQKRRTKELACQFARGTTRMLYSRADLPRRL